MDIKQKKGISLIVLVITIIVMIILASSIILSLRSSGIIGSANEAKFKSDMSAYKEAYNLYLVNELAKDTEFDSTELDINSDSEIYEDIFGDVPTVYKNSLKIVDGELVYETDNVDEIAILNELAIAYKRDLEGKVIVNFGDSIFGQFAAPENISTYLSEITGATVYNVGFGGCRMSQHSSAEYDAFSMYRLAYSIANSDWSLQDEMMEKSYEEWPNSARPAHFKTNLQTLESIDFTEVDIITISYGTNDFAAGVYLNNESDSYDTSYYNGALRYSIEAIASKYPNIEIVICTPIYRFWLDSDGNFADDSETHVNIRNKKLTDFCQAVKEIADEYNILAIDNYNGSGINSSNRAECFTATDGTHPNSVGRKMIAENIAKELHKFY